MILFQKDFTEQGAIVDYSTSNLSFLKMGILLNKMNVVNNLFSLALFDVDLKGKNPHNLNDPSVELRQRIAWECKRNPWYFLREVCRITASGMGAVPYVLNRSNLAQAWLYFNSINSFQVMPRQIGKTIGTAAIQVWALYCAAHDAAWGMFCRGNKLQYENVDRFKKIRDALPQWMLYQTANDTNNKEGVSYDALNTKLLTFVSQSDKQAAGDQARGQSFFSESWDEVVYYNNINLSYPSAIAAMDTAAPLAKESGLPAAVIMTSTAGDLDDPRGRWCYLLACDAFRFTEKLYDCKDRDELWSMVHHNSKNDYVYLEYNYKQLGKDDAWFNFVTRAKDPKVVAKDYLNQWLHGSDASMFSKELLEKIQASKKDPVAVTNYESVIIKWYDDPNTLMSDENLRNRPYPIGLDTSDNVGSDFTTMCMVDPYDLHVVCTFCCNTANLYFVTTIIVKFLRDFPRAIFIPERNKNGAFMLDYIFANMRLESFNPLTRIYNKYLQEYTSDMNLSNLNYEDGTVRKNFGFSTTSNSRNLLYSSVLMNALNLVGDRLNDASLVDQISGLTMKNGRVDHTETGHDDLLIAFLLAVYFILFGLHHNLYGIRPDEIMCQVKSDGELIDADKKKAMIFAHEQIRDLRQRVKNSADNPVVQSIFQRELQKLIAVYGEIPQEDDKSLKPLDQINKNAKQVSKAMSNITPDVFFSFA